MIQFLDCTLRDGGYINNWTFGQDNTSRITTELTDAQIDMIEIGYLKDNAYNSDQSIFSSIEDISQFIPNDKKNTTYLAMIDVGRFSQENIINHKEGFIDGIRVAFYKHQIEDAMILCRKILQSGYKLFIQPMVTADYNEIEYHKLIDRIIELHPFAVYIVDSFGYMTKEDLKYYFDILDSRLDKNCLIGFHSHNNMQLSSINAQSLFNYKTQRTLIIDSSIYGIGRAAGNISTEEILAYYNEKIEYKYDINKINTLNKDIIQPIYTETPWGPSPYYYLTAQYHCHPGYAKYILSENEVPEKEFEEFLKTIPTEFKTKCKKEKAIELFLEFKNKN